MRGLRFVLAQNTPGHPWTGMGRWAHETARALVARGHDAQTWFSGDFPDRVTAGRAAVVRFPPALARRLVDARDAFDVAVVHEPAGRAYARARRKDPTLPPLILMCHNVEAEVFRQLQAAARHGCASVPLGQRIRTPLFRLPQSVGAIRAADHVVCLSRRDREALLEGWGLPPDRVTAVRNGAPPLRPPQPDPAGPSRVLFVGGWLDVKGRRVLPALWHRVRNARPDAGLTLLGTGAPDDAVLDAFAPDDRASVRVIARERDAAAMTAHYAAHHVLVAPSISEGSPLTVLEAMAAGLPIAAAAVGGIPDLVRDRREALLFPACDPAAGARRVLALLDNRTLARQLAASARRRAAEWTWDGVAAAFERIARGLAR